MKKFNLRRLVVLMSTAGMMSLSHQAMAAAFMLWEQDAASISNYHAGVAAIADDASTNWYNAAGLIRIKNQELVAGADPILTDFKFSGTVTNGALINSITGLRGITQAATVQGGNFNLVPFAHYAAPISDRIVFGLSSDVPFGLKTDYGKSTFARYSSALTSVQVIDISPSIAFAVNDKLSFGVGADWQRLNADLDLVVGAISNGQPPSPPLISSFDSLSSNSGNSTAWGYHIGALYQFTPCTRVGLSYRSKVTHHVNGTSTLTGPLANGVPIPPIPVVPGKSQRSNNFQVDTTLPATTSLGIFHSFNPCWDLLGHVSYTQWSVFQNLVLQNVAGVIEGNPSIHLPLIPTNNLAVTIPEHYKNTWNVSVGANYHPTPKWILRTGIGWDQTPTNDTYRNLQLPDSDRIGVGLGGHYQATCNLGVDMGWTHIFSKDTSINNLSQSFGPEVITTNGSVNAGADVYGVGIKWDIT